MRAKKATGHVPPRLKRGRMFEKEGNIKFIKRNPMKVAEIGVRKGRD